MTIRRHLQLSFAAIALSALGIAFANYVQYRRLEGDAAAINLAGSGRMRAYRIAALAAQHVSTRDPAVVERVEVELAQFRDLALALRDGKPELGIKGAPTTAALESLDAAIDLLGGFGAAVRALVSEPRGDEGSPAPARVSAELGSMVISAATLAGHMDRATSEFERASSSAVRRYRDVQLVLFAAALGIALVAFLGVCHVLTSLPMLALAFQDLTQGRLGAEVSLGRAPVEVARLEAAFNDMSRELERARAALLADTTDLARRNEELVGLDRMKSQFIANVSHELRTPLTSILWFADLLKRGLYGPLESRQEKSLETILRNARHLVALIDDVLDLAKIEAGKMDVRPELFPVGRVVCEVANALEPLATQKGLAIDVALGERPLDVESDPARVRQILFNLISNAVKFTERGIVRVRTVPVPGEQAVRIEVEDTGVGIAPEAIGGLFQRFHQVDASFSRSHGGIGLGLHVSRRIADLLGARIDVTSEPGRGSLFSLTIPVAFATPVHASDGSANTAVLPL